MSRFAPWQQRVLDTSLRCLAEGRLGHAMLLAGPPSLGKRAVAEALAQRLLCPTPGDDGLACGACRSCRLFPMQEIGLAVGQAHPDLQRIGLEPNEKGDKLRTEISVEQIRRLGQWLALTPQLGGPQVVIIDPADLMNAASANALLKTLEEPSANRFLLLVSSRPGRLPATIRSRCQRLDFRTPGVEEASGWLAAQGLPSELAMRALEAARGNPGLAAHWAAEGALELRAGVLASLNAIASGRAGAVETAQAWLGDEQAELRLRFAADLVLDATANALSAAPRSGGLTPPPDFSRLPAWFDGLNRIREQLRAPLRNDLVLAGMLQEWRSLFETASPGGHPREGRR